MLTTLMHVMAAQAAREKTDHARAHDFHLYQEDYDWVHDTFAISATSDGRLVMVAKAAS